eukprot:EG_transcript_13317
MPPHPGVWAARHWLGLAGWLWLLLWLGLPPLAALWLVANAKPRGMAVLHRVLVSPSGMPGSGGAPYRAGPARCGRPGGTAGMAALSSSPWALTWTEGRPQRPPQRWRGWPWGDNAEDAGRGYSAAAALSGFCVLGSLSLVLSQLQRLSSRPSTPICWVMAQAAEVPLQSAVALPAPSAPDPQREWRRAGALLWDPDQPLWQEPDNTVVYYGWWTPAGGRQPCPCSVWRQPRYSANGEDRLPAVQRAFHERIVLQDIPRSCVVRFLHLEAVQEAEGPWLYLALERCLSTLEQLMGRGAAVTPDLNPIAWKFHWVGGRIAVLWDCCKALHRPAAELHASGVAHFNLCAASVLVAADGTVRLHNLSNAPPLQPPLPAEGPTLPAPQGDAAGHFANHSARAPELLRRHPRASSSVDVWALGVLAYQLLSGADNPFAV